jgi:hypothetical protein
MKRLATWILWLYPRAWRQRYHTEMLALLDRYPLMLWTLADLLLGAADAHLNRRFLPVEVFTMTRRIRTSASAILLALALFIIAWIMVPFIGDSRATWLPATAAHPEIGLALAVFEATGALALFTLLAGGAPLLIATTSQALREGRRDIGWRLATPLALAVLLIAYSWFAVHNWWTGQPLGPQDLTPSATATRISFFALTFVFGVLSAWAVASAVSRGQPSAGVVRFTIIPSVIITLALGVCLAALVTLTVLVFAYAPELTGPTYLMPSFDALTLCACLIATVSVIRMATPDAGEDAA